MELPPSPKILSIATKTIGTKTLIFAISVEKSVEFNLTIITKLKTRFNIFDNDDEKIFILNLYLAYNRL